MKRFAFLTTLALMFMIAVFIGCSDEDNAAGGDVIVGDTNSEDFQFVNENVGEGAFNSIGYSLDLSFGFIDEIPGPPPSPKQKSLISYSASDSVVSQHQYAYLNGWHIFSFTATIYDDEIETELAGTDSIQTLVDNTPVQYPDSTMNGIKIRKHFTFSNEDANGEGHHSYDIDATQYEVDGTGMLSGTTDEELTVYVADSNATCTLMVTNDVDINDVVLFIDSVDDSCPQSGSVSVTSGLSLDCTGQGGLTNLSIDGTWTLTAQFNGTTETYTFSNGTISWTVTETCDDPVTISAPLRGISFNR